MHLKTTCPVESFLTKNLSQLKLVVSSCMPLKMHGAKTCSGKSRLSMCVLIAIIFSLSQRLFLKNLTENCSLCRAFYWKSSSNGRFPPLSLSLSLSLSAAVIAERPSTPHGGRASAQQRGVKNGVDNYENGGHQGQADILFQKSSEGSFFSSSKGSSLHLVRLYATCPRITLKHERITNKSKK